MTPENGSPMEVVGVDYVAVRASDVGRGPDVLLVPYVVLQAINQETESEQT